MIWFVFLSLGLVALALFSWFLKRTRVKEIMAVFREYNEAEDLAVLTDWIDEKHSALRMVGVMDYLFKIEALDLALEVFAAFPVERFPQRHTRIFACRAYLKKEEKDACLALADLLLKDFPADDAILELYLQVNLHFGEFELARPLIAGRIQNKFKGTIFLRFKAQILAHDGQVDEAIKIMVDVTKRDQNLYVNTIAQPQKGLIYQQFQESQSILDGFQSLLGD